MAAPRVTNATNHDQQGQESNHNGDSTNLRGCHPCIAQKGSCRYGDNCNFAKISANACLIHLQHQLNASKPACKFGAQCRHSHIQFDASRTPYQVSKRKYLEAKQRAYYATKSAYTSSGGSTYSSYGNSGGGGNNRRKGRKPKAPSYHHKLNSTWHLNKDGTLGMNSW